MMIKNFQVMYGGTPEEDFKESEKESQLINQKTEELMNLPNQNPDPDKPFDLFYKKFVISRSSYSDKGKFMFVNARDIEGKLLKVSYHIKNSPPIYIPENMAMFNIDFEPLNNFMGYYRYDNDYCLISQYSYFNNLGIFQIFEVRIRTDPIFSSIFIMGIAAAVYFLHQKGICADGINLQKIYIDSYTLHPVILGYGNPKLMNKTFDDEEKELLDFSLISSKML